MQLQRDHGLILQREFNKTGIRFWFDSSTASASAQTRGTSVPPAGAGAVAGPDPLEAA
ncbi:MAG: hypothetical protein M0Z99_32110 [Betaproteobacteria bacterium]|nr:hypothetical protein [Betaproteobacteria bacterium]